MNRHVYLLKNTKSESENATIENYENQPIIPLDLPALSLKIAQNNNLFTQSRWSDSISQIYYMVMESSGNYYISNISLKAS